MESRGLDSIAGVDTLLQQVSVLLLKMQWKSEKNTLSGSSSRSQTPSRFNKISQTRKRYCERAHRARLRNQSRNKALSRSRGHQSAHCFYWRRLQCLSAIASVFLV